VAGLLAGVLTGALGAAAARDPGLPPKVRATVFHAAPVLAVPGEPLRLRFATVCEPATSSACDFRSAVLHLRSRGRWRVIAGHVEAGEAEFVVPGDLVPNAGFAYYAELIPDQGGSVTYPASGPMNPFRVASTAGFSHVRVRQLSFDDVRAPDGLQAFLPWGSGTGEVGRASAHRGEEALGPSSFAVGPNGAVYVADWVNRRILVLGDGYREISLPAAGTVDIAVDRSGGIAATTLGMSARAWRLAPDGRVLTTFRIDVGAPMRVAAGGRRPRVAVGPGQWIPVDASSPSAAAAERDRVRSGPLTKAASQDLKENLFAVTWPSSGGTAGALVTLPEGIRVGVEYFAERLHDGGALLARALWDDAHTAVGVFRFSASGELLDLSLLPEPSALMDARLSTVRFQAPDGILLARDRTDGIAIERYEVRP
jgi:hypothetical protein